MNVRYTLLLCWCGALLLGCQGGAGASKTKAVDPHDALAGHAHDDRDHDDHAGHDHEGDTHDDHAHDDHEGHDDVHLDLAALRSRGVEVGAAGPGRLQQSLELTGEVVLNADALGHVMPRITGEVVAVHAGLGDQVRQGQTLVVLRSRELASAMASWRAARSRVAIAQVRADREQQLFERGISPQIDALNAAHDLETTRIDADLALQQLMALGLSRQRAEQLPDRPGAGEDQLAIAAPMRGVVLERHVSVGEIVDPGRDLFLIADLESVWVQLNVPASDLRNVSPGQRVDLRDQSGRQASGTISVISPMTDGASRSAIARVILPNPERHWQPGQFVTAQVSGEGQEVALWLPVTALQTKGNQVQVYVTDSAGGVVLRDVTLGRRDAKGAEVLSGLTAGEQVVLHGVYLVKAEIGKAEADHGHAH